MADSNPLADLSDQDIVRELIRRIGDDPERDGLRETPRRVVESWHELYAGYLKREDDLKLFEIGTGVDGQAICVSDICFTSTCEHHLQPFAGTCSIAYLPKSGRVIGLSKLPRLVERCAAKLQVQERLTAEIVSALKDDVLAVSVRVSASHNCVAARGVRQRSVKMVTRGQAADGAGAAHLAELDQLLDAC